MIQTEKKKLLISFSGGETSAYMTQWLLANKRSEYDMLVVFANTGEETEETLNFVQRCDEHFGFGVVWVEYEHLSFNTVSFNTASRNGEPFEKVIQKFGIPNMAFPQCSRELKQRTIRRYAKSIGWKKYYTAIGIRSDEIDRISDKKEKERLLYPLCSKECETTKPMVNRFWRDMPFRLNLSGYEGNCKVCWKKSLRKLLTIAKETPAAFDNVKKWEKIYGNFVPATQKNKRVVPIRFFRDNLTVEQILTLSKTEFEPAKDDSQNFCSYVQLQITGFELDRHSACSEKCEAF